MVRITNGTLITTWPIASVASDGGTPSSENSISDAKPNASAGRISGDMNSRSSARAQPPRLRAIASAAGTPSSTEADTAIAATCRLIRAAAWISLASSSAAYQRSE